MALPAVKTKPSSGPEPYKLTVEELYRLDLPPERRFELLEGVIYEMPAMGPRHAALVERFASHVRSRIDGVQVREEKPVYLGRRGLLYPDLAVVEAQDYTQQHPQPKDVHFLVEVADTTLEYDRDKLEVYAKAKVSEVWIVNVQAYQVEVYRQPKDGQYRLRMLIEVGEPVASMAFPKVDLELAW